MICNKTNNSKIDFVVMGSEESCAINDFGYRTLIFANALSRSECVGKVLLINCPVSLPKRVVNNFQRKRRVEDMYPIVLKRALGTVVKVNEELYMLNLSSIFPESDNIFSKIDSELHAGNISRILKDLKFENFVLWIATPRMVDVASSIPSKIKIFDAIDDMLAHPQMARFYKRIKKAYDWVENNADLICIAAEGQRRMFRKSSSLFLMPNGVDSIFLRSGTNEMPIDMKDVPMPIVGYIGVLQDRLDIPLVEAAASILHDYNFVFVGPVKDYSYFKPLTKYRNVRFLGRKRYAEIPAYIRSFDVCIIPHKVNEFTDSMDPLKIYEYLACGKPIVSTPVAGTERFKGYIALAQGPTGFADAIKQAFLTDTVKSSEARRLLAPQYSWDNIIMDLVKKIELKFKEKK